jgi:hypothetical protein
MYRFFTWFPGKNSQRAQFGWWRAPNLTTDVTQSQDATLCLSAGGCWKGVLHGGILMLQRTIYASTKAIQNSCIDKYQSVS